MTTDGQLVTRARTARPSMSEETFPWLRSEERLHLAGRLSLVAAPVTNGDRTLMK
jgi:hypothetical protein